MSHLEAFLSIPFLKNREKSVAGLIIKMRTPDEVTEPKEENSDNSAEAIESCAKELIRAVHAQDVKAAANAIKDAFEILDSQPEDEDDHIEPHSYDAQNQKAAQED